MTRSIISAISPPPQSPLWGPCHPSIHHVSGSALNSRTSCQRNRQNKFAAVVCQALTYEAGAILKGFDRFIHATSAKDAERATCGMDI